MNTHTTPNKKARLELECCIIGACLIENCYDQIGKYLQPGNFTCESYRSIWQAIADLWPTDPVDMRTVNHHLIRKYDKQLAYEIATCAAYVNSAANVEFHAMKLLEIDIQSKVLRAIEQAKWHPADGLIKEASRDIWVSMSGAKDILSTLEDAAAWLSKVDSDHSLTKEIIAFDNAVSAKASQINSNYPVRSLLNALENIGHSGDRIRQVALRHASDLLMQIINSPSIPHQVIENLVSTTKALSA